MKKNNSENLLEVGSGNKYIDDKLLIAFIAPSGYGKSTAIKILQDIYQLENIKIAEPLYKLQNMFYEQIGKDIGDTQDGELLQFYGGKVRREVPNFLLGEFHSRVIECEKKIITNDDCRPYDYEFLKEMGFIFIRINGIHRNRLDHTTIDLKSKLEWQENIGCDYEVDNYGDIDTYAENLVSTMSQILNDCKSRVRKRVKE